MSVNNDEVRQAIIAICVSIHAYAFDRKSYPGYEKLIERVLPKSEIRKLNEEHNWEELFESEDFQSLLETMSNINLMTGGSLKDNILVLKNNFPDKTKALIV